MRLPPDATLLVIDVEGGPAFAAVAALVAAWREAGLPIVHGHPADGGSLPAEGPDLHIARLAEDLFVGTDLDAILTGRGATTLVLCGRSTHRAVEASARHACDLGFRVFVVADACTPAELRAEDQVIPAPVVQVFSLAQMRACGAVVVETVAACLAARLATARHPWRKQR